MASKLLHYPAEIVMTIEGANEVVIDIHLHNIDLNKVIERMRHYVNEEMIKERFHAGK